MRWTPMSLVEWVLGASKPQPEVHPADPMPVDGWPKFDGPLDRIPRNTAEVYKVFGNPGAGKVDPKWKKANIVEFHGKNALPGIPPKFYFQCHRLAEPYMREALARAQVAAPDYKIERAASFVFRHMRHNPKMPLSRHAWGIAIDVNPDDNRAITFDKGKTPKPWSPEWNKVYPNGMPQAFVEAFESVGFRWGGRWRGYLDPMHMELVKP